MIRFASHEVGFIGGVVWVGFAFDLDVSLGLRHYCLRPAFVASDDSALQQANHLSPDDLIQQLLSDEAAVVANQIPRLPRSRH